MKQRLYSTSLEFDAVRATFQTVAESAEPLRGVLTKGMRPLYYEVNDQAKVQFTMGSTPEKSPMWIATLLPADVGFSLTITQAWTHNDEIGHYKRFEQFRDRLLQSLRSQDPGVADVTPA